MKKMFFIFMLLIMLFSLLSYGLAADAKQEFLIKACVPSVSGEPATLGMQRFAELVEERSRGRIKFDVYIGGALGNDRDLIEGLQLGTVQVHMASNSPLAVFAPGLMIFEMPFLFENDEHFNAVLDSDIAMSFIPELKEKGFHLLGFWNFGVRHIMTTEKAVNSMEDLKGLKIRLMECPAHLDAYKAYGASPLPMAYSELYTSLETGVIDGAEAANSNYWGHKFYEVAPNWAMAGWLRLVAPLIMSQDFYDKLPVDLQKIVDDAARDATPYERELYSKMDEQRLGMLIEKGVNVTYPDRDLFMKASKIVYDKWSDDVGGYEKINAILDFKY